MGEAGAGMTRDEAGLRAEVAEAAHVLARLGLVTAFGHVSARVGGAMLITPAADLAGVSADGLIEVPLEAPRKRPREGAGALPAGRRPRPGLTWRCTGSGPTRTPWPGLSRPARSRPRRRPRPTGAIRPLHGQAAWLGERIPVHDDARLLRSPALADAAAASLPDGEALLLRGNGALTLGATPGLAVARMWLLSVACQAFLDARGAGGEVVTPLRPAEVESWRAVAPELLPRLWQQLRAR